MKVGASVLYLLSRGSGHMAGESTWCRSADFGTPNCVAHTCGGGNTFHWGGGCVWQMLGGSGRGHADTMFIRGHMCSCLAFWERELCAPPWVVDTVKSGYVLPFYSLPTPFYSLPTPYTRPNQCTALPRLMMLTMQWVSF